MLDSGFKWIMNHEMPEKTRKKEILSAGFYVFDERQDKEGRMFLPGLSDCGRVT